MLKTAMLVSALALSAPALAQDQTTPGRQPMATAPAAPQAAPVQNTPAAPTDQAATAAPQTDPAAPVQTAPAQTAATPADATTPVTGATQIAQVVNTEFPTYDKNADTNLDKTEFGAWMVALKTASDPTTKATDPATAKWIEGAFTSADVDKSKLVSKTELTSYLSQGAE